VFLFIVPVIVIAFLVSSQKLKYLQIRVPKSFIVFVLGAVTILIATPVISYLGELNAKIQLPAIMKSWEDTGDAIEAALMAHHTVNDLVWNLVVMALAAAVSEEFFFRAGMQTIIIKMSKNKHIGIWITAIIFSAIHLQFSGFFPRMFLGAFLGYLFVWSGSIWVNIFAHFMFNGIQILYSYLQDAKATTAVTDKMLSEKTDYLFAIISAVLVTLLVLVIYKLTNKKQEEESETLLSS
jgi:membrane protease YdiL (CAAX protease family)